MNLKPIRNLVDAAVRPMTEDESTIMLNSMLSPRGMMPFDDTASKELGFSGQVLFKRLESYSSTKLTLGLAVMIVIMSKGNPGQLVMWAYTMHCIDPHEDRPLTINDFAEKFPHGVPSDIGFAQIWDDQKGDKNENLIDQIAYWN